MAFWGRTLIRTPKKVLHWRVKVGPMLISQELFVQWIGIHWHATLGVLDLGLQVLHVTMMTQLVAATSGAYHFSKA